MGPERVQYRSMGTNKCKNIDGYQQWCQKSMIAAAESIWFSVVSTTEILLALEPIYLKLSEDFATKVKAP